MRKSAIACGLLASVSFSAPVWANDDVTKLSSDPKNWAIQSGNYAGHRHSKLNQITTANVGSLKVAWTFSTGVLRGHEGSPLVIGDMMYLHTAFPNNVYALNLKDENKIIWQYSPKQDPSVIPVMCCDTVNRGVQYAEGKILLHQADTSLVALDAKTGKELWKERLGGTFSSSPVSSPISNGYARSRWSTAASSRGPMKRRSHAWRSSSGSRSRSGRGC